MFLGRSGYDAGVGRGSSFHHDESDQEQENQQRRD
jgi:hypothetical protein